MFERERKHLLDSLDVAHAAYDRAQVFGGPSLYFHVRALDLRKEPDCDRFAEAVYALLTAWGMHRMGRGGSKMRDFGEFKGSLNSLWPKIKRCSKRLRTNLMRMDGKTSQQCFKVLDVWHPKPSWSATPR
jgi:hypothetical protein